MTFQQKCFAVHIDEFEQQWIDNTVYQGVLLHDGFSVQEKEYAASFKSYQHLAVRFACKCAIAELTGQAWHSFEVMRTEAGVPYLRTPQKSMISLTHDGPWAIAYVTLLD